LGGSREFFNGLWNEFCYWRESFETKAIEEAIERLFERLETHLQEDLEGQFPCDT
jgi:hypothetical protein